jgi:hypothetical protein
MAEIFCHKKMFIKGVNKIPKIITRICGNFFLKTIRKSLADLGGKVADFENQHLVTLLQAASKINRYLPTKKKNFKPGFVQENI